MGLYNSAGARITKAAFPSTPAATDPEMVVTADVFHTRRFDEGTVSKDSRDSVPQGSIRTLKFRAGDVVRQSVIDKLFPAATVAAISPVNGPVAGGTVVTITGTNLDGVSGVTFGGTAGTNLKILTSGKIQVTTPAKSAGAVAVVLADEAGAVTQNNGYTFV
jgi:hypothetical protein